MKFDIQAGLIAPQVAAVRVESSEGTQVLFI